MLKDYITGSDLTTNHQQDLARVISGHLLDWHVLTVWRCQLPTALFTLVFAQGSLWEAESEDKNPQGLDCRILDYFLLLVKLLKKAFLRKHNKKLEVLESTQFDLRRNLGHCYTSCEMMLYLAIRLALVAHLQLNSYILNKD